MFTQADTISGSKEKRKVFFHIDINNAYLSWHACHDIHVLGKELDLRTIPSVIGGDESKRHGIVLAKSPLAKTYGIQTAEPLASARRKCPNLTIVSPDFPVYANYSRQFISLLEEYAPVVEQYSIDEAFCNMTGTEGLYGPLPDFAHFLRNKIKNDLGFTVNIGISSNYLLAKMASDFEKPDKVHTLFPEEISEKMWPLPVDDLFFVGKSTARRLHNLGIHTIGQLARTDLSIIQAHLGKTGIVVWNYANGQDDGFDAKRKATVKSYSHGLTISYDVTDKDTARMILLSLCETVASRIRADNSYIGVVSVSILSADFQQIDKQETLDTATNVTEEIYHCAERLFYESWCGQPIRQLTVSCSKASRTSSQQINFFDGEKYAKYEKLNQAVDKIRDTFGEKAITRASLLKGESPPDKP